MSKRRNFSTQNVSYFLENIFYDDEKLMSLNSIIKNFLASLPCLLFYKENSSMYLRSQIAWRKSFLPMLVLAVLSLFVSTTFSQAKVLDPLTLDGPTSAVDDVSDVSLALDGDGAVLYRKDAGAKKHVFLVRLVDGKASGDPVRLDTGQDANDSFLPTVAAGNGGKLIATWVNGAQAYSSFSPNATSAFSAPTQVGTKAAVSDVSVDMNGDGVGYATLTDNNDVFAYRLNEGNWNPVNGEGALDNNAANGAGGTMQEPRVSVTPQGSAFMVWSENNFDEAYFRKLDGTNASGAVRLDDFSAFGGRSTANQASRKVRIQGDVAGNAWVTFEQFADYSGDGGANSPRLVARKIDGSTTTLSAPVIADGMGNIPSPIGDGGIELFGSSPNQLGIAINNAGNGLLGFYRQMTTVNMGTRLNDGAVSNPFTALTANAATGGVAVAIGKESNDGFYGWIDNKKAYIRQSTPTETAADKIQVSSDAFGDAGVTPLADASRFGDGVIAFKQGADRVVFAAIDQPPSAPEFVTPNAAQFEAGTGKVEWKAAREDWGKVNYVVKLNGKQVASSDQLTFVIPNDVVPGNYSVSVVAQDREGQSSGESLLPISVKAKSVSSPILITLKKKAQLKKNIVSFQITNVSGSSLNVQSLLRSKRKLAVRVGKRTRRKIVQLGSKRVTLAPGKTVTIRMPLSATGHRLLKKLRRIPADLTISASNSQLKPQVIKQAVTLRMKK